MVSHDPPEEIIALGEPYVRLWLALSEFPSRAEVSRLIRIYTPRSLANLDCQGLGPPGRLIIAGRVCYKRDQVILWFAGLASPPKSRRLNSDVPPNVQLTAEPPIPERSANDHDQERPKDHK